MNLRLRHPKPMPSRSFPDCRTCGACCGPQEDTETYVDLYEVDVRRLSPGFRRKNVIDVWHNGQLAIRTVRGASGVVCAALAGSVGHRVSCRIYPNRPTACREAAVAGSPTCLEVRRAVLEK